MICLQKKGMVIDPVGKHGIRFRKNIQIGNHSVVHPIASAIKRVIIRLENFFIGEFLIYFVSN